MPGYIIKTRLCGKNDLTSTEIKIVYLLVEKNLDIFIFKFVCKTKAKLYKKGILETNLKALLSIINFIKIMDK